MATYPNQKLITIHKEKYYQDFLQVGIDEWREAYMTLNRGAFGLYLYLCGNMDGYRLGLSTAAIQNALGISDSTYRRAIESLLEAGYLIQDGSKNKLHFYTKPQLTTYVSNATLRKMAAAPVTCASAQPPKTDDEKPSDLHLIYSYKPYAPSEYGWTD